MANDPKAVQSELAERWRDFDLAAYASRGASVLMHAAGDWDLPADVTPSRELIRLSVGIPDATTIPKDRVLESARKVITAPGEGAYIYGFGMGYPGLRVQLAERYTRDRGVPVDETSFQITNGSAGAIDLVCRSLVDPGDVILSESPAYMGTLRNFRGVLADIRPLPMDADGILIDELAKTIARVEAEGKRIKLIYAITAFQNPTGATLSLERRFALLQLAADHGILILDDDAYGELGFETERPRALSALSGGAGVITVGTFSKILAPGLRMGWIHAAPELVEFFGKMRFAMGLNQVMVRVVSDLMGDGWLDEHVANVRALYRRKMTRLADALDHYAGEFVDYQRPKGGFYLWVSLLQGLKARDVWRTGVESGVSVNPGANFFTTRRDEGGEHLRVAYAWTPESQLEEGARRLAQACQRVATGRAA